MSEVPRRPERESRDPVSATYRCVRFEMKKVDVFTNGRCADLTALFHDQSIRQNPGQADSRAWMNLVAELFFQERSPELPGQNKAEQHQERFHNCAPRLR